MTNATRSRNIENIEDWLWESEEKLRGIVESFDALDVIFTVDLEGRFTYVSPATKRIAGYEPEELVGKPIRDYLPESEIAKVALTFTRIIDGENVEGMRLKVLRKDGSIAYVEIDASPIIKDGMVIGVQGILRDVTERNRMEEALRQCEERLRIIYENTLDGLNLVGAEDNKFLYGNDAFCQMLGISPEELKNTQVMDIHPDESLSNVKEQFKKIATLKNTIRAPSYSPPRNTALHREKFRYNMNKTALEKLTTPPRRFDLLIEIWRDICILALSFSLFAHTYFVLLPEEMKWWHLSWDIMWIIAYIVCLAYIIKLSQNESKKWRNEV